MTLKSSLSRYEDMVANTSQTIIAMAAFLGYAVPKRVMACVLKNKDGLFKRKHRCT